MKLFGLFLLCITASASETQTRTKRLTVGSDVASAGEFPFLVSLQMYGHNICGGSLISTSHVLTAAHCIVELIAQRNTNVFNHLSVEVGSTLIGRGKRHAIQRIAHRSDYRPVDTRNPYLIKNDIAVITLKTPVVESSTVRVIGFGSKYSKIPVGSQVIIPGFGSGYYGGRQSKVLKKTQLTIISNEECSSNFWKMILPDQICAKFAPNYGACQGDSGGPMIYNKQVVAVLSAGDSNCGSGNPDVFTKVSHSLPFIRRAMQGRSQGYSDTTELDADDGPKYARPQPQKTVYYPWQYQTQQVSIPQQQQQQYVWQAPQQQIWVPLVYYQ